MAALDAVERKANSRAPFSVEIRPDPKYVILRGSPSETEDRPFDVKGKLVVTAPHRCNVKAFKIFLEGTRSTSRPRPKEKHHSNSQHPLRRLDTFLQEEQTVTHANGEPVRSLEAGTSVFDFVWTLKGDMPETVVGLSKGFVRYDMKAVVERTMWQGQLKDKKHIRIIRTLPYGSTLLTDPWSTEGVWEAKGVKYSITTTSQAAALGDVISVQFEITHLHEKVAVNECELVLKEYQKFRTTATNDFPHSHFDNDVEIKRVKIPVPTEFHDHDETTGAPRKRFTYNMALPQSLNKCRQSVPSLDWIQVLHRLHCHIYIVNLDGHVSRVQPRHDMHIFISEHRPIEETSGPSDDRSAESPALPAGDSLLAHLQEAPPRYSTHYLDRVYESVDDSVFNTPAPSLPASGATTPGVRGTRRSSADAGSAHHHQGAADHSADLASRLRGLELRPMTPVHVDGSPHVSRSSSHVGLSALAGPSSLPNNSYNMEELERLQSYATAVRTPPAPQTAGDGPPSYVEATSQPPSPTASSHARSRQHSEG